MPFAHLPSAAAWRHIGSRQGFEVLHLGVVVDAVTLTGHATVLDEHGEGWTVSYELELDAGGRTRRARVTSHVGPRARSVELAGDGEGRWTVDGEHRDELDGCLDVDLEASAATNALPVRRLDLEIGERAAAPAVFVRAPGLEVERLEQQYVRLDDDPPAAGASGPTLRFGYTAPGFDYEGDITYDPSGLVLLYPFIGVRA